MPFTLDQFARRWPCLYHLTAAMNPARIEIGGCKDQPDSPTQTTLGL